MDSLWIVLISKRENFCPSTTLSVKLNTLIPNIMLVLFPGSLPAKHNGAGGEGRGKKEPDNIHRKSCPLLVPASGVHLLG